jgi:hypothetical protein
MPPSVYSVPSNWIPSISRTRVKNSGRKNMCIGYPLFTWKGRKLPKDDGMHRQ